MNMSEDIAGSVVQVGTQVVTKGVDLAADIPKKTIDAILKLLNTLSEMNRARKANKVKSTNLTGIKAGLVDIDKLQQSALRNNDTISYSKNGITLEDKKFLEDYAKKNNFPIAFIKGSKDCYYPAVRTSDSSLLELGCTEMIKEKIATRPQELGNFKLKSWEQTFMTAELNKYNLSANFAKTKDGQVLCIYEKADEKAIMIARDEYLNKVNKLNSEFSFEKDENGMYSIKELRSGNQVSFDEIPSRSELTDMLKDKFGFDDNLAEMASAKFGEEQLLSEDRDKFFADDVANNFSDIESNVSVEGEDVLVKPYDCWYLTEKGNQKSSIVFQNSNGDIAILRSNMSRKEMKHTIEKSLGISDKKEIEALTDKAYKVSRYFQQKQQGLYNAECKYNTADGKEMECKVHIKRTDKSKAEIKVTSGDGQSQTHIINLRDKKNSKKELSDMFRKLGMSETIADRMAEESFKKAKTQSPDSVVTLNKIEKDNNIITADVTVNGKTSNINIDVSDKENSIDSIKEEFDIEESEAKAVFNEITEVMVSVNFIIANEEVDTNINSDKENEHKEFNDKTDNKSDLFDNVSESDNTPTLDLGDIELDTDDDDIGIGGM